MRVAIQGVIGSFHHLAARRWYGESADFVACESFGAVFAALKSGKADEAVIAIENSLYGSINEVYDLLKDHHYPIIGEQVERIHQNLITLPGVKLSEIKNVISHPVALAQCSEFLNQKLPAAGRLEYYDTAASLSRIIALGDRSTAAISSAFSAELAGLPILRAKIENHEQNYTRFLIIKPNAKPLAKSNKASMVLETSHKMGALWQALWVFASANVNLLKLQSRPLAESVWKYQFYIDVAAAGTLLKDCISKLEEQNCTVTLLGEYRAHTTEHDD